MATTYYKRDGTGTTNWNSATSWSTVSATSSTNSGTFPIAGDTANFTAQSVGGTVNVASACATLNMTGFADTLSGSTFSLTLSAGATLQGGFGGWTTGAIILTGGGMTLAATPTGTAFPTIQFTTAAQTLTSGGFVWPGAMTFSFAATYTLVGNLTVGGLVTVTAAITLSGAYVVNFAGGLNQTGTIAVSGVTLFEITGGTWTSSLGYLSVNLTLGSVDIEGTCCFSGSLTILPGSTLTGTGVLTYTGTNLNLTTNGVALPNLNASTLVLNGNLVVTGTLVFFNTANSTAFYTSPNNQGITGVYNILCANLIVTSPISFIAGTLRMNKSQSITVTNSLFISAPPASSITVMSGTTSTPFNLNYLGTLSNAFILGANFTDVNTNGTGITSWVTSHAYAVGDTVAQGGMFYYCAVKHTSGIFATDLANGYWVKMNLQPLYSQYCATPSTLLRTTGIVNIQANSFTGMFLG